ncbi:MFS transporter [Derxia gummosa]|uniref:MFS transporter n=1 Tax=Derxia gummosa DSM 723 TaxID=1121388 RepID=A0A8B6X2M2_9BURK|nr:MFS transporter [Derxia gummosa]
MTAPAAPLAAPLSERARLAEILRIVALNFVSYLCVGLPLAVVAVFVHDRLGLGTVMAGVAVSAQYLATTLSRPGAGRRCDSRGARGTMLRGLAAHVGGGLLLVAAALAVEAADAAELAAGGAAVVLPFGLLVASRLLLGLGESWAATAALSWGIANTGGRHMAQVISWNGIATYGALSFGAPIGLAVFHAGGFLAMGLAVIACAAGGWLFAWSRPEAPIVHGRRMPLGRVFRAVLPHGAALCLATLGFGCIASFIGLHYASRGWAHPAGALTAYGLAFIAARLLFADAIGRAGGYRVALCSLVAEAAGLALLGFAPTMVWALAGAALTGFGFSLVFPALGVEAVGRVDAASRGAALGAFAVFLDGGLALAGPVAGLLARDAGYAAVFLAAGGATALAFVIALALARRRASSLSHNPDSPP